MMSITIGVLLYEGWAYNVVFLARMLPAVGKSIFVLPLAVIFNSVWFLAVWSYIRAHLVNPGFVPTKWHTFVKQAGNALPIAPSRAEWQPGKVTFCHKCEIPRPERAKHCKICETCILRMDHHCPWINNCVGFNNHKFFLLVGIYSGMACIVALGTAMPEIARCVGMLISLQKGNRFAWGDEVRGLELADFIVFLVFGCLALVVFVLLVPLLCTHVSLAMRNVTSIEENYDNMPNPFDQGSASANLAHIFGAFGPDWFVPIAPRRPLTDGVSFHSSDDAQLSGASHLQPEQIWQQRFNVPSAALLPLEQ
eukprot:CAMPEP_0172900992 /NCGR_PEP_ID=MMETSP1075-20121228/165262_1 /TAXON_ID=2916 /ORGANISM="Ceratium fusus, Strain PA161109" /LENGTH=308 /DNA_ID=CAMNT_0013757293 /DNA_START=23 /DNA_END=946 /DNA_ORIENTATION=-